MNRDRFVPAGVLDASLHEIDWNSADEIEKRARARSADESVAAFAEGFARSASARQQRDAQVAGERLREQAAIARARVDAVTDRAVDHALLEDSGTYLGWHRQFELEMSPDCHSTRAWCEAHGTYHHAPNLLELRELLDEMDPAEPDPDEAWERARENR